MGLIYTLVMLLAIVSTITATYSLFDTFRYQKSADTVTVSSRATPPAAGRAFGITVSLAGWTGRWIARELIGTPVLSRRKTIEQRGLVASREWEGPRAEACLISVSC